jgi:predicted hydrocarbon binding protein
MVTMNPGLNTNNYLIRGLEEVLGPVELANLHSGSNNSGNPVSSIRKKMDELYGPTGARGLAICSGRAAFKHLLAESGREIGFEATEYRFLPIRSKIRRGLEMLAKWIEKTYTLQATLYSENKVFRFEVKGVAGTSNVLTLCDFTSGLLQEFLAWTSGGKFYAVHEAECRGTGAEQCSFLVGKYPLE